MAAAGQSTNDDENRATDTGPLRWRRVVGDDGVVWEVREVCDAHYDRRTSRSLVFIGGETMRRVRNYPADWGALTDADLLALSRGR